MVNNSFVLNVNKLIVPSLKLQLLHVNWLNPSTVWTDGTFRFVLDGKVIWDFPHDFMSDGTPQHQRLGSWGQRTYQGGTNMVESLCCEYLDRPRAELFEPFSDDHWGLVEVLRAADRRVGFRRLTVAALLMSSGNDAARQVLAARFPPKDTVL